MNPRMHNQQRMVGEWIGARALVDSLRHRARLLLNERLVGIVEAKG
jgi:hypothetical protein